MGLRNLWRQWRGKLGAHVAILAVALLAIAPWMDLQTSWTADEGAYALEVHALQHGTWQYDYIAQGIDPHGTWFPIAGTDGQIGGRYYAYLKRPLDVVLPWLSVTVFGPGIGYHLPSMVGALLTAVAAWLLAAEWNRRSAVLAFWLAAVSPVAINAYLLWAHALSAGIAGLTLWAGIRCWRSRGDLRWALAAAAGATVGVLLRPEGLLFAAAVGTVIGLALALRGAWRGGMVFAAGTIGITYAAHRLESGVISRIVGQAYAGQADTVRSVGVSSTAQGGYFASRLLGGGHDLFAGSEYTPNAQALLITAVGLVAIAGLLLRTRHRHRYLLVFPLLVAVAWLYHARFMANPMEAAPGLLAAWPILVVALLCIRPAQLRGGQFQLVAVVLLFVGALVGTDYAVGGGLEWGGRFFSPALAPLAALAAGGLIGALGNLNRPARLATATVLATLALLPAALGLQMLHLYRTDKDLFYNELASRASSLVIIVGERLDEMPRGAWRLDPQIHWLIAWNDGLAADALAALHAHGVNDVTILKRRGDAEVTGLPYRTATDVTGPVAFRDSYQLLRLSDSSPPPSWNLSPTIVASPGNLPRLRYGLNSARRVGDQVLLVGWFLPAGDTGTPFGLAFLTGSGAPAPVYPCVRSRRPDVAAGLHLREQLTGFSVMVPLEEWMGQPVVVDESSYQPRALGTFPSAASWPNLVLR